LDSKLEDILHQMITSIPLLQSALNFFLNRILIVKAVPKYLNSSTISNELLSKREERKPTRCNNIDGLLSIMDVGY